MAKKDIQKYLNLLESAESIVEKIDIQREAFNSLSDKDADEFYDYLLDSGTYVSPRVIHMGLNTTKGDPKWEELKENIRKIVEEDGVCQASWSCEGRTRHYWQSQILEKDMPEYDFTIGYNYQCEIRKK